MGDAVLFIFPADGSPQETCDRVLDAVKSLTKAIQNRNQDPEKYPLQFGCGLHYGTVMYGNVGTAARLDFTVMGPAVNLASRLEGLTSTTEENCLLSAEFARHTSHPVKQVGSFELKGISSAQEVFAPLDENTK